MCRPTTPVRAPVTSTCTQSMLDSWYNVQVRRRRNLRGGRHSVSYNNHTTTQNTTTIPRRRTQLSLDDYIGYNDSAQSWSYAPAPINEDEISAGMRQHQWNQAIQRLSRIYPHRGNIEISADRECPTERDKLGMARVGASR
jgi:hypothetical protein